MPARNNEDLEKSIEATLRWALRSGSWLTDSPPVPGVCEKPEDLPILCRREGSALPAISESLAGCQRCRLSKGRTHIVFGTGNPRASILFVGEGPGAEEDKAGEPFVGRAGKLLDKMIAAIGLRREEVYIANVVKCRPPENRDPAEDEIATCLPFLEKQIEAIAPKVICALGRHAGQSLLKTGESMGAMRGKTHQWKGIPVIATYHPAYLLRTPSAKRQAWEDLKKVSALAGT
jgi:DNA polymerase